MTDDRHTHGFEISRNEGNSLSLYPRFEQLVTWVLAATVRGQLRAGTGVPLSSR
jgi:hypothetical protein